MPYRLVTARALGQVAWNASSAACRSSTISAASYSSSGTLSLAPWGDPPKTGESLTGGPDAEAAKAQRLRAAEAMRRLSAGDEEAYHWLMSGEDLEPTG